MAKLPQPQPYLIRQFGAVGVLQDSTQLGGKLTKARNTVMRPLGAMKSVPKYLRLWAIGSATRIYDTLAALTYTPFGGSSRAINVNTDDTIAVQIVKEGFHFLMFYSLPDRKCRGFEYLGNDGTFTGTPDFTTGTPTYTVLAVNLDPTARWYGRRYYGALFCGNGVNPNAIVQINRSANPGVWRLAASNARPAAAIIRQVTPASATNVQASWTIPGGGAFFTSMASVGCYINQVTDTITNPNHGLANGNIVHVGLTLSPGNGGTFSVFYVINATTDTFQVSLTLGGAAAAFPGTDTAELSGYTRLDLLASTSHPFSNGNTVTVSSSGSLPTGLATATTYYVVSATMNSFGLATTLGGTPIGISARGVGIHKATNTTSGARDGNAALTFTANLANFPGTTGHNIFVSIFYAASSYGMEISSVMTGSGTVSDPYHYALTTVLGASSNNAIVAFVNSDTSAIGIVEASTSTPDASEDNGSWALTALSGGVDGGVSGGFTNKTVTVYLRYWDPGVDNLGYEGISSDLSNTIVIDATSNYDVEVLVNPDPTAEGGRFGYIRIYMQFGEEPDAVWNLVGEVPNVDVGSKTFTRSATVALTSVSATTDRINKTSHGLTAGMVLRLSSTGSIPGGLSSSTTYYVRDVEPNSFRVALTSDGAAVNITSAGTGTLSYRLTTVFSSTAHGMANGSIVRLTTSGSLPNGLLTATDYYVGNVTANTFTLSLTSGGTAVEATSDGSGTQTVTVQSSPTIIGSNTIVSQEMAVDQHRVLPASLSIMSGGFHWHAGVTAYPSRLYPSKSAVEDELVPEGANNDAFEDLITSQSPAQSKVTALYTDDFRLHVHQSDSIVIFPPANPTERHYPQVLAGAANQTALTVWAGSQIYYLGADLNLYEFNGSRYGKRDTEFASLDAAAYVRDLITNGQYIAHPERLNMFADVPGQMLWYWLPGADSELVGFAYDFLLKGTIGPFDFPKAYAMTRLEASRTEYVFADEDGNLFVWDSAGQPDHGDTINGGTPPSAPTVHTAGTASATPANDGYGDVAITGGELWQAVPSQIETGFLDIGSPGQLKTFSELIITSVAGSRGRLDITVTSKNGNEVTRYYGDIADRGFRQTHKVQFAITDTAVKVGVEVVSGEQQAWTIRDMTLMWAPVRRV